MTVPEFEPFIYVVKPQNRRAVVAVGVLSFLSLIGVFASTLAPHYRGLIALATVVLFTATLILFTRYILAEYTYTAELDSEGEPTFVVTSRTGRRVTTLFSAHFSAMTSLRTQTRQQARAHRTPMGVRRYRYTPTLMPDTVYRMAVRTPYEQAEVLLELTEPLARQMRLLAVACAAQAAEQDMY